MITFAETYCSKNYPLHKYELLTGKENLVVQSVYNKLGYTEMIMTFIYKNKLRARQVPSHHNIIMVKK